MAIFKCKMCGGTLEINNNETVAVCEYCGTKQTLPKLDDERKANLYDRANHFRRNNEFDKAMGIYEQILNDDNTDAESYWSIVLCRYGIEYVEDPKTKKRIPTVNRAQYTSIFADEDYKSAIQYADENQKEIYESEAKAIDEIQKGILEISQKEEPFDVFICYKETDANGRRTPDSVLATELYHELTRDGFKVFFSRITLEDKLGEEYEPYIFAALNSAKVMVVLGTKPEHFNAVWVKNEWSRYLALIKNGAKKMLVPAYKDMDPYDLPEEFSHLQAQDMSKLGFMQDLVRGISKIISSAEPKTEAKETVVVNNVNTNIAPLLKRAFMFLEDGDFARADEFCEQVLNLDPECAEAYLGKLMVDLKVCKQSDLKNCEEPFDANSFYQKIIRFADAKLTNELKEDISYINERNEIARKDSIYEKAISIYQKSKTAYRYKKRELYQEAYNLLDTISDWKDSAQISEEIKASDETLRIEDEQKDAEIKKIAEEQKFKTKRWITIVTLSLVTFVLFFLILINVIIPSITYNNAIKLMDNKEYQKAIDCFMNLEDYKDSSAQIQECYYLLATGYFDNGNYNEAIASYSNVKEYKDSQNQIYECYYLMATNLFNDKKYDEAIMSYRNIETYKDSQTLIQKSNYLLGKDYLASGNLNKAAISFGKAGNYLDAKKQSRALWDKIAVRETIAAGGSNSVALKSNGTVVATKIYAKFEGSNPERDNEGQSNVNGWKEIIAIAASEYNTFGLKSNGSVVIAGKNHSECSSWTDIVAISAGDGNIVGLKSDGTVVIDCNELSVESEVSSWTDIVAVSTGSDVTAGLKVDGTVVATAYQDEISLWTDIVAISAGDSHVVGLKSDGTVVAVGDNGYGQCNVSGWKDIVAISAGDDHTVGLKSDGTVVAVGLNEVGECDVSQWTDIVAIEASVSHTVGLKSNGTVVAVGWNGDGQCDVDDWMDIVAISAGGCHTVGLKSDGTVVAVGDNYYDQCDVSGWEDIVAISTNTFHTIGLKSDGTVVAVGSTKYDTCNVSDWKDIVAISAGEWHTVGLKSDGTVVAVGHNRFGQCLVGGKK